MRTSARNAEMSKATKTAILQTPSLKWALSLQVDILAGLTVIYASARLRSHLTSLLVSGFFLDPSSSISAVLYQREGGLLLAVVVLPQVTVGCLGLGLRAFNDGSSERRFWLDWALAGDIALGSLMLSC